MFTGLVEHIGKVVDIQPLDKSTSGGGGWSVTIGSAEPVLTDCHLGDSICVNGACLTVTEFTKDAFKVGLAPETLDRTDLGNLSVGSIVNLERAMQTGARYGGHFVQGHVDTTARIVDMTPDGNSIRMLFQLDESAAQFLSGLVPKGYVAIDGTSLTLTSVDDKERTFGVMLIAHTQEQVILAKKHVGEKVNIEVDVVAKTVAKVVSQTLESNSMSGLQALIDKSVEKAVAKALGKAE